jgi:hypothetical protein
MKFITKFTNISFMHVIVNCLLSMGDKPEGAAEMVATMESQVETWGISATQAINRRCRI